MGQSSMLHVRVDEDVKAQATEALVAMGMSVSYAVRIFLKRVVNDQAFPIELKVPNAETRAAMEESRQLMKSQPNQHESAQSFFDDLEKDGEI
jgi:DNA-damage-inducible protein J